MLARIVLKGDKNRLVLKEVRPAIRAPISARRERVKVYIQNRPAFLTLYVAGNEVYVNPLEVRA